ncbi:MULTISPECIES: DUF2793 domain-containing protein [Falsihalocynthiibacter]|uniref:DUF2793 domain-containing protein n=1 Tax=Falsihalocynthiibacter TaxID=2854182 RepID=UPI0030035D9B
MTNTGNLGLPLVQPSQAQKHITVNESLAKLDGLTQLILISISTGTPPLSASDGASYGVPIGGVNAWAGHDGEVAIFSNGGWVFSNPQTGWRAWIADQAYLALFDGSTWAQGAVAQSPNGAKSGFSVLEFDHVISAGSSNSTAVMIPSHAMLFGVSGVVVSDVTGTLTSWSLGKSGSLSQFGSGLGLASNSYVRGTLSSPYTEYSPTSLLLTADGGDFASGTVRLAIHYYSLTIPSI